MIVGKKVDLVAKINKKTEVCKFFEDFSLVF